MKTCDGCRDFYRGLTKSHDCYCDLGRKVNLNMSDKPDTGEVKPREWVIWLAGKSINWSGPEFKDGDCLVEKSALDKANNELAKLQLFKTCADSTMSMLCTELEKLKAENHRLKLQCDEYSYNESKMNGALSSKQEIIDTLKAQLGQMDAEIQVLQLVESNTVIKFHALEAASQGLVEAIEKSMEIFYARGFQGLGCTPQLLSDALAEYEKARGKGT
jgi:hypothetical protein